MIEEVFEAIETEEDLRLDSIPVLLEEEKCKNAEARGLTLKKMRLRQSLGGEALEYYLNSLVAEVRIDYDKTKKALLRCFSDQAKVTTEKRKEDAKWAAIARMTNLLQGSHPMKDYILELEDIACHGTTVPDT
jgi:hypothetical protein